VSSVWTRGRGGRRTLSRLRRKRGLAGEENRDPVTKKKDRKEGVPFLNDADTNRGGTRHFGEVGKALKERGKKRRSLRPSGGLALNCRRREVSCRGGLNVNKEPTLESHREKGERERRESSSICPDKVEKIKDGEEKRTLAQ